MVSAAYMTGAAEFEIERTGNDFAAKELWKNKNLNSKFSSSVFWQGYIYGLDEDILVLPRCEYRRTEVEGWTLWLRANLSWRAATS